MSDLISRQAAIDAIKKWGLIDGLSEGQAIEILADEEKLPPVQPEQRWIPCRERLPDEGGKYLVTAFEGTVKITTIVLFQPTYRLWGLTGRRAYWKVIAWMPLPDPWEEEDERSD